MYLHDYSPFNVPLVRIKVNAIYDEVETKIKKSDGNLSDCLSHIRVSYFVRIKLEFGIGFRCC